MPRPTHRYLRSEIRGIYNSLYLILDIYSRKIAGWEVEVEESGEHGAALVQRTALREGIAGQRQPLVLHAENGSPMKSATLLATLQWFGVQPSHSRPRVSNDNAYAESVFRTCRYRPDYPADGFPSLDDARMDAELCDLVQHGASTQWLELRDAGAALHPGSAGGYA